MSPDKLQARILWLSVSSLIACSFGAGGGGGAVASMGQAPKKVQERRVSMVPLPDHVSFPSTVAVTDSTYIYIYGSASIRNTVGNWKENMS